MVTETDAIQRIRAFNRFYTKVIGALGAGLAGTAYSLTEARTLYELAQCDESEVETTQLRDDLGLDAGYLSRILKRFADGGLVEREASPGDGRRQVVRLTRAGRTAFGVVDARSDDAVRALLRSLDDDGRDALVTAMDEVRRRLGGEPSGSPSIVLRGPEPGDLGWVVSRNGALYASQFGWDATYEALVAGIVAGFVPGPRSAVWIAEIDGERSGCVFCVPDGSPDSDTARLRLLLVEPSARGHGLGSRLVDECLRFARRAGYRRITLWTNDVLSSARHIYQRAGFHLDDENEHHSFGADLVGQNWSRDL